MVEFALVGPLLLLLLLIGLDFGRGIFYYSEIADAAREGGRQAVLQYNQDSNTAPGSCTLCQVPGVMPEIQRLAAFGFPVVYANSTSINTPPWYGTFTAAGCSTTPCETPGTINLAASTAVNTVYVFIYEINPTTGDAIWAAPATSTSPVRNGGHRYVVVDLRFKFQPVVLQYSGISSLWVLLDSQTVQPEEY